MSSPSIHPDAPLVVAEAVWQYSHHVLPGLRAIAVRSSPSPTGRASGRAWSGMLNLNGSLHKAGVTFQHAVERGLQRRVLSPQACANGCSKHTVDHDSSHVRDLDLLCICPGEKRTGRIAGRELQTRKAILGVFDEGCMGMYNAIIDDELLNPAGRLQGAAQPVGAGGSDAPR